MQLADAQAAREVVGPHRCAEQPGDAAGEEAVAGEHREQERQHPHEVRCGVAQYLALGQRLVDEADLALLEVTDAPVHELRRLRRRARGKVVALDERGAQAPGGGVERNPDSRDPAPDDEHVELLVGEAAQRVGAVEVHLGRLPARHLAAGRPRALQQGPVAITVYGVCALSFMMAMYALETRHRKFVLAFAGGCVLSSAYGFLSGAWPFGVVELIWSGIALRRYLTTHRG